MNYSNQQPQGRRRLSSRRRTSTARQLGIDDAVRENREVEQIEHNSGEDMEDDAALEDAQLDEEGEFSEPPVHISRLPELIRSQGFQPYQRSSEPRQQIEDRFQAAENRYEDAQTRERRQQRRAALAQSITTIADLFVLNQKGGEGITGGQIGARMSQEASQRLEAERITFEKELEAYYERIFRDAELEERVDQRNTQIANQIKREDFAAQIDALNEQLRNAQSGDGSLTANGVSRNRAVSLVNSLLQRGQDEQAMNLARHFGIVDEDFNINMTGLLEQEQEEGEVDPYQDMEAMQAEVLPRQYQEAQRRVSELQRKHDSMTPVERQNSSIPQQLERAQQELDELAQNEHVQRSIQTREFAKIQIERHRPTLQSAHRESDEFAEAAAEYVRALQVYHGMTSREAEQVVIDGFVTPQIRQEHQRQASEGSQSMVNDINDFLENNPEATRENADAFLNDLFDAFNVRNEDERQQIRDYIYQQAGLTDSTDAR